VRVQVACPQTSLWLEHHRARREEATKDSPAYLIHEHASEELENWLQEYYLPLFENILGEW
jgi:hypothetical protein